MAYLKVLLEYALESGLDWVEQVILHLCAQVPQAVHHVLPHRALLHQQQVLLHQLTLLVTLVDQLPQEVQVDLVELTRGQPLVQNYVLVDELGIGSKLIEVPLKAAKGALARHPQLLFHQLLPVARLPDEEVN